MHSTLAALQTLFAAAGEQPAGGAAMGEVVGATAGALVFTGALLALGARHRSGKSQLLQRGADLGERITGLPGWAAFPSGLATISLLTAVFGMYWDIALHIGVGRDEGPLANPAHYFILIGLFGIFASGFVAMVLPRERPSTTAIKISKDWYAPLGGVLVCACGAFSLSGFPLDDFWHRLFGQDVTLWGPTHLMLIGGASMTLVGMAVLLVEGIRAKRAAGEADSESSFALNARRVALTGGFMLGLSTFQAEFDFGVPQFRFVFGPMLVMLAAGVGLVATRLWLGRGAALGAVAFFLVIRGGLALIIGPGLGETTPYFPLYIVEAALIELVALRVASNRPLVFGAVCGALIGTVGLAAEWGWTHVWLPLPWPSNLLPEGALLGFTFAMAGSLMGAWIGARLNGQAHSHTPGLRPAAAVSAAVVAVLVGLCLYKPADPGVRASVAIEEVRGGPERMVNATVEVTPREKAESADWLTATAWQGDGLVVNRLEEVGPGRYRTTEPIPVYGNWKSLVRLHEGNSLMAVPIFLPEDKAIPAKEVPAPASFTREFVTDHEILQREQKATAAILPFIGYGVVLAISFGLLGLLAWGLHRLATAPDASEDDRRTGSSSRFARRQAKPTATTA